MRIGIVSDSHGKVHRLGRALEALAGRNVEVVVHCGDVGSEACIELLALSNVEVYAVAGNLDRHVDSLRKAAEVHRVHFATEVIEVPLEDGRYLVVTHGHDGAVLEELIAGGQFPYICRGHTHRFRDERRGAVRIINPGALRFPRDPRHPTAALLDTKSDILERIDLKK